MNRILVFFVAILAAIPAAATISLASFFVFNQTWLFSSIYSLFGGILVHCIISAILKYRFLKKHGLTRKEYQYIENNLNEAKQKLFRLHKALMMNRHIPSLKQRIELIRITRKIYSLTKKEPKRFYQANEFYFSHLDSMLELTEKYNFLSSQPKKNLEIDHSLFETRRTMEELSHSIEKDLYGIISEDIDQLQFELDVAKQSISTINESP